MTTRGIILSIVLLLALFVTIGTKAQKAGLKAAAATAPPSVTLTWTQGVPGPGAAAVSGNNVYRGTTSGGETLLVSLTTPATTYTDTAVTVGSTYYYEVTAVNSAGPSAMSNEVVATIPNNTVPSAPVLAQPTVVATTAPAVTNPYNTWASIAFPPQSGNFEIQFDAVPSVSDADAVVMLSQTESTAYATTAVPVRMGLAGVAQAMNASTYSAVQDVPYTGGEIVHWTIDVNMAEKTFSAYVGSETRTAIAVNFGFRTGAAANSIGYLTMHQDADGPSATDKISNVTVLSYPLATSS
jgi:hypothetical protein